MNGLLSAVGVLKTLFPLCFAPLRVSQHIVILTTELLHRFFTRFLSTFPKFFFPANESVVISDALHIHLQFLLTLPHKQVSCSIISSPFLLFWLYSVLFLLSKHILMSQFLFPTTGASYSQEIVGIEHIFLFTLGCKHATLIRLIWDVSTLFCGLFTLLSPNYLLSLTVHTVTHWSVMWPFSFAGFD